MSNKQDPIRLCQKTIDKYIRKKKSKGYINHQLKKEYDYIIADLRKIKTAMKKDKSIKLFNNQR